MPERSKPHKISSTLGGFPSKYLPKSIMEREGKLNRLKNQQFFLIHIRGKDTGQITAPRTGETNSPIQRHSLPKQRLTRGNNLGNQWWARKI